MQNLIADLFILFRNARAWMMAFVLFGALLWTLWATHDRRIEYKELSGELIEIVAAGNKDDPIFYNGKVRLEDGSVVGITMSVRPPVPKVGDKVPVIFERYEGGKIMYGFNNTQWLSGGGISN